MIFCFVHVVKEMDGDVILSLGKSLYMYNLFET